MFFQEDTSQDIKTFWGIPMNQLLKILIPLGLGLMVFLVWAPFPWGILGKTVFALVLFFGVAIVLALKLPRYYRIIKHYRERPKVWTDRCTISEPTTHRQKKKALIGPIQDLINVEKVYTLHNKVLLEWKEGRVSLICRVQAQPIDFLPSSQLQNIQKGIKNALAAAASNHMSLAWSEDSDFAYNESFWENQKTSALENIVDLPQAVPVTMARMECYEGLIHGKYAQLLGTCVQSTGLCRIDADLAELMREETGSSDQEKKERALRQFAYTTDDVISAMAGADLHLFPIDLWDVGHLIFSEFAPWLRGCKDEAELLMQWMEPILTPVEESDALFKEEDVSSYDEDYDEGLSEEEVTPEKPDSLYSDDNNPENPALDSVIIPRVARPLTVPPLLHTLMCEEILDQQ